LRWGMDGVTATMVASETAMSISRGVGHESVLASARFALPGATWSIEESTSSVCVTATLSPPIPLIPHHKVRQCVTA
jgi:hypothetical protein